MNWTSRWRAYPEYRDSGIEWLEKVPAYWEVKRLKYVAAINKDSLAETTDPDFWVSYVDISSTDSDGNLISIQEMPFSSAPSRARRRVADGDTILSTVRTYLRAIAFMDSPPENRIVSTGFAVLHPCAGLLPEFLWRMVQSDQFVNAVVAHSDGVGYPAIPPTKLAGLPVCLAPLPEQIAIADFLDRETAKIDALIAKKERLIELLQEKRAALISHAVTKGLDPTVPMKDSGIPAVGRVPTHWRVRRNKLIFREVDERSITGSEELLTVSHITGVTPRSEKDVNMFLAESTEGYKVCHPDDLVINTMWAWMGAVGVSEYMGIVSPSYNVYRLRRPQEYLPKYLDLLYRTPSYICEMTRHSKGVWTSRLRLYPDSFFDIHTLTPPLAEQHQIVQRVLNELKPMGLLANSLRDSIHRLKEYRTALISAAVTGQIDVRHLNEA